MIIYIYIYILKITTITSNNNIKDQMNFSLGPTCTPLCLFSTQLSSPYILSLDYSSLCLALLCPLSLSLSLICLLASMRQEGTLLSYKSNKRAKQKDTLCFCYNPRFTWKTLQLHGFCSSQFSWLDIWRILRWVLLCDSLNLKKKTFFIAEETQFGILSGK